MAPESVGTSSMLCPWLIVPFVHGVTHISLSQTISFVGVKHNRNMDYALKLDTPDRFYAECHRPQHFLSFVQMEDNAVEEDDADIEDFLT